MTHERQMLQIWIKTNDILIKIFQETTLLNKVRLSLIIWVTVWMLYEIHSEFNTSLTLNFSAHQAQIYERAVELMHSIVMFCLRFCQFLPACWCMIVP